MAMAAAPGCALFASSSRSKAFSQLDGKFRCFGVRLIPTTRPQQSLVIRSSSFSSSIVELLELAEAAAPAKRGYVNVTIAAVVVPLAMAAAAVAGGFVLKRRIRSEAIQDAEEFRRLVEGGMDPEEAKALIFKRIDEQYDSPPMIFRRRRGRRAEEEREAAEAATAQVIDVEKQVAEQHEQPT